MILKRLRITRNKRVFRNNNKDYVGDVIWERDFTESKCFRCRLIGVCNSTEIGTNYASAICRRKLSSKY